MGYSKGYSESLTGIVILKKKVRLAFKVAKGFTFCVGITIKTSDVFILYPSHLLLVKFVVHGGQNNDLILFFCQKTLTENLLMIN